MTIAQFIKKLLMSKKQVSMVAVVLAILILAGIYWIGMGIPVSQPKKLHSLDQIDPRTGRTTPAPLTTRQKEQLTNDTSSSAKQKIFDIVAGNFYFSPNKITVNEGDTIIINLMSRNGLHDFIIDDLHIRTPLLQDGRMVSVRFIAEKKGIYAFYSDTPPDRHYNMKGILVIQ